MGMPINSENRRQIAADGTIFEVLDDGTIKRIGKLSDDGKFEPFGGPKDGIRVRDGIIYRVINGKEVKIGRIFSAALASRNSIPKKMYFPKKLSMI
ncbi:hypothetical protein J5690_01470 [bacterium]|nr:hypothetical protein [bacterium]